MVNPKRSTNWKRTGTTEVGGVVRGGAYSTQRIVDTISEAFTKDLERIFEKKKPEIDKGESSEEKK